MRIINILVYFMFIITMFSCVDISSEELKQLRLENTVLRKILSEVSTKYIFDSISISQNHKNTNTYKIGSYYESEMSLLAFGENSLKVYEYDTLSNNPMRSLGNINLTSKKGNFILRKKLKDSMTNINVRFELSSKYGNKEVRDLNIKVLSD